MFKWEGHSEVDKYALSVYEKHFPESEALGDITAISNTRGLPEKLDLVTFGFPCQDLSVAGKRGGIGASRSGLFTKAMRIIRAKKPSYIIFENVKGLYSSNEGRDFAFVLRTLANAGYDGQWQLLNTRWFLPQNRERVYFVGHLRGTPRPEIFPIGEGGSRVDGTQGKTSGKGQRLRGDNSQCSGSLRVGEGDTKDLIANTIQTRCYKDGSENLVKMIQLPRGYNKGSVKDECGTITKNAFEHNNFVVPLTEARTDEAKEERRENLKNGKDYSSRRGKKLVPRKDAVANTISTSTQDKEKLLLVGGPSSGIRRLTPTECERLQGFPDTWTKYNKKGKKGRNVSDTQRYKMMGNAVSVPVVKEVVSRLLKSGVRIDTYLDLFSGVGGFRLGIEEAINEFSDT